MNEPPDHTDVFSAENLLSSGGMTLAKYGLTSSGYSRRRGVHVGEQNTLLLEVLAVALEQRFGLVLSR